MVADIGERLAFQVRQLDRAQLLLGLHVAAQQASAQRVAEGFQQRLV